MKKRLSLDLRPLFPPQKKRLSLSFRPLSLLPPKRTSWPLYLFVAQATLFKNLVGRKGGGRE